MKINFIDYQSDEKSNIGELNYYFLLENNKEININNGICETILEEVVTYYDDKFNSITLEDILKKKEEVIYIKSDKVVVIKDILSKVTSEIIVTFFPKKSPCISFDEYHEVISKIDHFISTNDEIINQNKLLKKENDIKNTYGSIYYATKKVYITKFEDDEGFVKINCYMHKVFCKNNLKVYVNNEELEFDYSKKMYAIKDAIIDDFNYYELILDQTILKNKTIEISIEYCGLQFELVKKINDFYHELNLYKIKKHCYATFDHNLIIKQRISLFEKSKFEYKLMKKSGKKVLINRLIIKTSQIIYRYKKIILISDRGINAADNGESFYFFLKEQGEKNIYYILEEESIDYLRLKEAGFKIIKSGSFKHLIYSFNYDVIFTSHQSHTMYSKIKKSAMLNYRDLEKGTKIFLQHGVTYNNHSWYLNKYNNNINYYICASKTEQKYLSKTNAYDNFIHLGFPRYDYLDTLQDKNNIFIMFTWRKYLTTIGSNKNILNFTKTEYFQKINELLSNKQLLNFAKKNKLRIKFFLHKELESEQLNFTQHELIDFCNSENSNIQELIKTSKMLITDYSSVLFDFLYQKKPIINYWFDYEEFFSSHYSPLIDLEKEKVVAPVKSLPELIKTLEAIGKNNLKLSLIQEKNIGNFFEKQDCNNNRRIYEYFSEFFTKVKK